MLSPSLHFQDLDKDELEELRMKHRTHVTRGLADLVHVRAALNIFGSPTWCGCYTCPVRHRLYYTCTILYWCTAVVPPSCASLYLICLQRKKQARGTDKARVERERERCAPCFSLMHRTPVVCYIACNCGMNCCSYSMVYLAGVLVPHPCASLTPRRNSFLCVYARLLSYLTAVLHWCTSSVCQSDMPEEVLSLHRCETSLVPYCCTLLVYLIDALLSPSPRSNSSLVV